MKKIITLVCTLAYILICASSTNAQWQKTSAPDSGIVHCLVASGTNLFAGTSDGLFISKDSGSTWNLIDSGLTNTYVNAITAASGGTMLFAGTENGLFLSSDTGVSWRAVNNGLTNDTIVSLAAIGTNVFVGTQFAGAFLSTDSGAIWTPIDSGLTNPYVYRLVVSGTNIFAGTSCGGLYFSTDTAKSWKFVGNGLTDSCVWGFAEMGTNTFLSNSSGSFFSSDTGKNWTAIDNGLPSLNYVNTLAVSGTNVFAATAINGVYLTANNGGNWVAINTGLTAMEMSSLVVSGNNLFAGTVTDGIWKLYLPDVLAVENISTAYDGFSIYPNPVTSQLTIRSSSFHNEAVTVSVMNVLGEEVFQSSMFNLQSPVNVSALPSGIYFVRVADEKQSWVGRFVKE